MENKYYTPEPEDIRIGYEYEMYDNFDIFPENVWHKLVYGEAGTDNPERLGYPFPIREGRIRTLYLTKEQIVAEGWRDESFERMENFYVKGIYFLSLNKDGHSIHITNSRWLDYSRSGPLNGCIYTGKCPSINEFRFITKLLEV